MATPKPKADPLGYVRERIEACATTPNDCWPWPSNPPQMTVAPLGTNHPVSFLFAPDGRRRNCSNPVCVNPAHFTRKTKARRVLDHTAHICDRIASCAPDRARAQAALKTYPVSNDAVIVPCWLWSSMKPQITVSPLGTNHPVSHFMGGRRRICADRRCVNPYHFARVPRPPTTSRSPMVFQCEGEVAAHTTLRGALETKCFPPPVIVMAYRNMFEDGMLPHQARPPRLRKASRKAAGRTPATPLRDVAAPASAAEFSAGGSPAAVGP